MEDRSRLFSPRIALGERFRSLFPGKQFRRAAELGLSENLNAAILPQAQERVRSDGQGIARVCQAMQRKTKEIATVVQRLRAEVGTDERDVSIIAITRLFPVRAGMQGSLVRILTYEECQSFADAVTAVIPAGNFSRVIALTAARGFGVSIGPLPTVLFAHQDQGTERRHPQHLA